jgi:hypothetical protein
VNQDEFDENEDDYQENPSLANWGRLEKNRDIFDGDVASEIEYERVVLGKTGYSGGPRIRVLGDFHYLTSGGYDPKKKETRPPQNRPFRSTSLFTWTSKMSCPSFSIPAGPVENGGTCPASKQTSIEKEGSYEKYSPPLSEMPQGEAFICSVCYAGKGRYLMYKSMSLGQVAKLRWVQKTLREGTFIRRMSEAISSLIDPDVERILASKLVSNEFFRIHDSGDFFSPEYYKAWVEICYAVPKVTFWAPTRQWVYAKWRELFSNYPPPRNLSLRPSALVTSFPPPQIKGMAGGSTSISGRMPSPVWNCPAYEGDEEHSCAAAGCRVCWSSPQKPVNYLTH